MVACIVIVVLVAIVAFVGGIVVDKKGIAAEYESKAAGVRTVLTNHVAELEAAVKKDEAGAKADVTAAAAKIKKLL